MDRAMLLTSNPVVLSFHSLARYARHLVFAAAVTLLLILVMGQLIATEYREPVGDMYPPIKPIHLPEMKIIVERSEPPVRPMDPPSQPVTHKVERNVETVLPPISFGPPAPGGSEVDPSVVSRDPLPVFKPAPRYPSAALRRGVEGYVVVEFTITETGGVRDARAVAGYDSAGNPTDIFNRSAVAAAARFKYQPQLEDGVPVERHGVRNRITYKIAQ
ncbi:outer membrane transport energization protein TonB (TC 2.C.1.1.1) [Microbulbifer donghaiensis]|uniref:Outer membrane transport energization protein TonB (TC 2.C.1.1.1) n=1 Tax=Microbulbifer donghaiensis TaxID=494016 RepID=A0A1M5F6C7_9GAMM|nr:energy transducer TonB [Microbulbifer donghaiensis]SHF87160.1 outer membrane transport energization protein TonB (TC 2.C.1.1.1) [Microbulbifer donghaiensis]